MKKLTIEYTELMSRKSGYATQKLFELDNPIKGFNMIIISCKPNGANGLKGSYFIFGSRNGDELTKELDWDMDNCDFDHNTALNNFLSKQRTK